MKLQKSYLYSFACTLENEKLLEKNLEHGVLGYMYSKIKEEFELQTVEPFNRKYTRKILPNNSVQFQLILYY